MDLKKCCIIIGLNVEYLIFLFFAISWKCYVTLVVFQLNGPRPSSGNRLDSILIHCLSYFLYVNLSKDKEPITACFCEVVD